GMSCPLLLDRRLEYRVCCDGNTAQTNWEHLVRCLPRGAHATPLACPRCPQSMHTMRAAAPLPSPDRIHRRLSHPLRTPELAPHLPLAPGSAYRLLCETAVYCAWTLPLGARSSGGPLS